MGCLGKIVSHIEFKKVDESDIQISEILQCGDEFLIKFRCPHCWIGCLIGFPARYCECGLDLSTYAFLIPHRRHWRLLCGTRRKRNISKKIIISMFRDQLGLCAYCNADIKQGFHVEHVIPLAVGGTNKPRNLVLACSDCNFLAGPKAFTGFMEKKNYVLSRKLQRASLNT